MSWVKYGDSYHDMGEDDLDERSSREVDWQGRWRLHFQGDETARYLDFMILEISCFIYSKRQNMKGLKVLPL